MQAQDYLAIGLTLNTKGILSFMVFSIGLEFKADIEIQGIPVPVESILTNSVKPVINKSHQKDAK